jgi:ABC-2 type transport system permease protein
VIRALRALPDMFRVSMALVVAYRAELVIWILTATLPLIMLALWSSVASEGPVGGLDQDALARYYVATMLVRQLTSMWLVWGFADEVRTGSLNARLLKPMHPFWHSASTIVVAIPLRMIVLVPLVAAVVLWRPTLLIEPDLVSLLLVVPTLAVAWLLNFAMQAVFGLLAFWFDKADGLWMVFFAAFTFLSGYVAPLALFPEWSQPWVRALPFRAMHGVPTELLSGMLDPMTALVDLGIGVVWLVVTTLVARQLWVHGLRRYGAFGA